jgi:ATP-binding cassette subfamily G (WHITE) protein 2 (SNQ2)
MLMWTFQMASPACSPTWLSPSLRLSPSFSLATLWQTSSTVFSSSSLLPCVFLVLLCTTYANMADQVMPALILAQVEPTYILARNIFIREDSSKMYSPWVFSLAQLVAEMPNSILCAVVFFVLLTYPAGKSFEWGSKLQRGSRRV